MLVKIFFLWLYIILHSTSSPTLGEHRPKQTGKKTSYLSRDELKKDKKRTSITGYKVPPSTVKEGGICRQPELGLPWNNINALK